MPDITAPSPPARSMSTLGLVGLLSAVGILRIGSVGTAIALQFDFIALGHGVPNLVLVGGAGAIQGFTEMVSAPFLARFADRIGTTRMLIAAPVIGIIANILFWITKVPLVFAVPLMLAGLTSAAFVPASLSSLATGTHGHDSRRVTSSSIFEGAVLIGYAGGFIFGPFIWTWFGTGAFLILALFYLVSFILCTTAVPQLPASHVTPIGSLIRDFWNAPSVRLFLPAWIAANSIVGMYYANFAALFHRRAVHAQTLVHHFSPHLISIISGSWILLFIIGMLCWIPLVMKWGATLCMKRAMYGAIIVPIILFVVNHITLHRSIALLPFLAIGILIESGFGPSAVSYLAEHSDLFANDRASLMALYTITLAGGSALGALIGGIAAHLFLFNGLIVASACMAVIAIVASDRLHRTVG
ncbi:MAG: MFS transporter [Candidatus Dormibacteria bacterium]